MGLIFSLLGVTLAGQVPFDILQYAQCSYYGLNFVSHHFPLKVTDIESRQVVHTVYLPGIYTKYWKTVCISVVTGVMEEVFLILLFICYVV